MGMLYVVSRTSLALLVVTGVMWGGAITTSIQERKDKRNQDDRMIDTVFEVEALTQKEAERLMIATRPLAQIHGLTDNEHWERVDNVVDNVFSETMLSFRSVPHKEQRRRGGYLTYLSATMNVQGIPRFRAAL